MLKMRSIPLMVYGLIRDGHRINMGERCFMISKKVTDGLFIVLMVMILSSCRTGGCGERQPHHVFLLAPQYLNSPQIGVGSGTPIADGNPYIKIYFDESSEKDVRPFDVGGRFELEYSENKNSKNEILNALGSNVSSVGTLLFYDVVITGSPVFYADAVLYGRAAGEDLSDRLFNENATIRVSGDYHFDGYFHGSEITLREWLKEGNLINAYCQYFDIFPTPSERLEGVTFTLEIPVKYSAPWPAYKGSIPYPDNPETILICSAAIL